MKKEIKPIIIKAQIKQAALNPVRKNKPRNAAELSLNFLSAVACTSNITQMNFLIPIY